MTDQKSTSGVNWQSGLRLVVSVMAAFALCGTFSSMHDPAWAEIRSTPPRAAFQSGGARSEKVLIEISATLKRIEKQLMQIEKAMRQSDRESP